MSDTAKRDGRNRKSRSGHSPHLSHKQWKEIERAVLVEGKTFSEVGKIYGRSGERMRQIVYKLNPHLNRRKPVKPKFRTCVNCGKRRYAPPSAGARFLFFGDEKELCRACRQRRHAQGIELTCTYCEGKVTMSIRSIRTRLRNTVRRKGNSFLKLEEDKASGTYVCRTCFYKHLKRLGVLRRSWTPPPMPARCVRCGEDKEISFPRLARQRFLYNPSERIVVIACGECYMHHRKDPVFEIFGREAKPGTRRKMPAQLGCTGDDLG